MNPFRSAWPARRLAALVIASLLVACSSSAPRRADQGAQAPGNPESSQAGAGGSSGTAGTPTARVGQVFPGTNQLIGTPTRPASAPPPSEGIQLQFVDVDITTVVASVIADGLGAPYVIDPSVKGTMTLQSTRPLTAAELVPALETALQAQGYGIANVDGTYRVFPLKDAPRVARSFHGDRMSKGKQGYGIEVVPLKYVSAAQMEKTLEPFAPPGGILQVDEGRNLLILSGTGQDIRTMLDVVDTFDVDWLQGMSFALYTLNYVDAKTLVRELNEIFADPRSPLNGIVRLVPIPRLDAVMVVTPQSHYLAQIEQWVKRLDLGGTTPGRRIYVYDVQNTKASDLAKSLSRILSLPETEMRDSAVGPTNPAPASGPSSFNQMQLTPGPGQGASPVSAPAPTQYRPAKQPSNDGTQPANGPSSSDEGELRIVPNDESNSLLIFATPSEFAMIEAALKRIDTAPRQVLIEATLAEVTLTDDLQFGIQWSYQGSKGPVILSQNANGSVAQQFPGFSFLFTGSTDIQAVLNALESITKVTVLSNPKLMVLNNHEADLQVGDSVPVTVQSAVSVTAGNAPVVSSVEYRDTGVILHVTPRVNQNGLVQLDITQEVSDVVNTTTSGINSPTIEQRKLTSTVSVRSGDTIALGGLISENNSRTRSGIPYLARIPLIGALFRSSDDTKQRTELLVLITPKVVRDDTELHEAMQRLREEFRDMPSLTKPQ